MIYLSVFLRAFVIVALTAANVRMVSQARYGAAFLTGGALSAVWWGNANIAAHQKAPGAWFVYALGAACGTVTGMWLGR